jgi:hypothetical protein
MNVTGGEIRIGIGAAMAGAFAFGVAVVAGLWAVVTFVINPLYDDLADLRDDGVEAIRRYHDGETALRTTLAELTTELRVTNERLGELGTSVSDLDATVQGVNATLAQSIDRQEDFERWVTLRLGPAEGKAVLFPNAWQVEQEDVFRTIASGVDPLKGWYDALSTSKN